MTIRAVDHLAEGPLIRAVTIEKTVHLQQEAAWCGIMVPVFIENEKGAAVTAKFYYFSRTIFLKTIKWTNRTVLRHTAKVRTDILIRSCVWTPFDYFCG